MPENHVTLKTKVVIEKKPSLADCSSCGAASGHWPSCPHYPFF